MLYRLFGWWYRWQACKLTAQAVAGWDPAETGITPRIWCLAVFFEEYMLKGAALTREDFGPKEPVELKPILAETADS